MNIPRLLEVLFEIKAEGITVHLDVRRYPPPTHGYRISLVTSSTGYRPVRRSQAEGGMGRVVFRRGCVFVARTHAVSYFLPFPLTMRFSRSYYELIVYDSIIYLTCNDRLLKYLILQNRDSMLS